MQPLTIRPMTLGDLDGVIALENVSFAQPWPRSLYERELKQGRFSSYFVVVPATEKITGEITLPPRRQILGHGGYWLMEEEIHIVTIATAPQHRGQGIGRWLLLHMLATARRDGGHTASLEVRPSNKPALTLYKNLGFRLIGQRKRYYPDGEDALVLEIGDLELDYQWRPLAQAFSDLSHRLSGTAPTIETQD